MNTPGLLARIAVIIVNYNAGIWLKRCVESLLQQHASGLSISIVDNGSQDNSLATLTESDQISIDQAGTNLGFAGAIERARTQLVRDFILVLNPDCLISPTDLERLANELNAHPEAGLVSGKVVGEDGLEQRASRRQLPTPRRIWAELRPGTGSNPSGIDLTHAQAPDRSIEIEAVSGACMLIRRSALESIRGFDTAYPLHFEDLDLFARLHQAGWTIRWCPDVKLVHVGGVSSTHRPVAVLWAKHRGLWRYLNQHCKSQWPIWQRPLWAAIMLVHAALKTPLVWLRQRR